MSRRRSSINVTVDVDVDVCDVIDALSDQDLRDECMARGLPSGGGTDVTDDDLERLRFMLSRGETQNALCLVERMIGSLRGCDDDLLRRSYQAARDGGHPFLNLGRLS